MEMTNQKIEIYLSANPNLSLNNNNNNNYIYPATFQEMKAFLGLIILCGCFRAYREPTTDLFSEDSNFDRPIFRTVMPRERFKSIKIS